MPAITEFSLFWNTLLDTNITLKKVLVYIIIFLYNYNNHYADDGIHDANDGIHDADDGIHDADDGIHDADDDIQLL